MNRSRIRPVSRKRAVMVRVYRKHAAEFLEQNPACARCGVAAQDVHHMAGRGAALLDESRWLPLCRPCHRHVTEHPAEAIAEGWSLPRVRQADDGSRVGT